jgi:hypothetical protein
LNGYKNVQLYSRDEKMAFLDIKYDMLLSFFFENMESSGSKEET